ncbi:hypothetical protein PVAND_017494 [Polypedilum vanderplanki]
MSKENVITVKDEKDFEEKVLKSKDPVVIAYDAPWCQNCKIINSKLQKVVRESEENIKMAKVDVEECKDLAEKHDVLTLPVLALAKDGEIQAQSGLVTDLGEIREFVNESLSTEKPKQKKEEETFTFKSPLDSV